MNAVPASSSVPCPAAGEAGTNGRGAAGHGLSSAGLTAGLVEATMAAAADPGAVEAARRLLGDALAVAVAGSGQAGPLKLLAVLAESSGPCPVPGHRHRLGPLAAAKVNGAMMHVLDYEPMWNPANHAVSTTVPALLSLAAARDVPDHRLLEAIAVGVEAQARLRLASGQFEPKDLTLHPPGLVGPVGAALASAHALGLDVERRVMAAGIAASRGAGLLANVGTMTKALHCGQAAAAGLEAALLAEAGFTAHPDALGGEKGFLAAYFGAAARPGALTEPNARAHVCAPGPAWKLYPSQYGTHFVITAALEAADRIAAGGQDAGAIARLRIVTPPMPYIDRPRPRDGLDGKFSFQYTAACALIDRRVDMASFSDRRRFAADMEALLARTELRFDPAREGRFDRMVVDLECEMQDGARIAARCAAPPGAWGHPIAPERLAAKAFDCFAARLGPQAAEELAPRAFTLGLAGSATILQFLSDIEQHASQGDTSK